jgi:nucleoside-diphosphate-sugar epimerase
MSKYFLTGGEGFIGFHLTKRLLDEGDRVITFDAQKHYIPFSESRWPFYQQYRVGSLNSEHLVRLRGDCTDRGLLKEALEEHQPDIIIHLAALPIAGISNKYPTEAKVNILDSITTLLDVLRGVSFDFQRLVYASSSMVYGDFERDEQGSIIPASETQQCNPVGIYGAMKLSGEYMVKVYHRRFGIPFTIIRPSAVYGPTDCNRRVTEVFLSRALRGEKLQLDNGGEHQLDFTYVADIVDGFIRAAESENALGEIFNITRGEGRRIRDLATVITDLIPGTESTIEQVDVFRPNRGALSIEKACQLLDFNPKHSLEAGMEKYHNFVREAEAELIP